MSITVGEGRRPEVGVGAIVTIDGTLLLVRRGRPPGLGLWSVPGGRIEAGESAARAVEREVLEECGIQVRCGAFLGWVERIGTERHDVILDFFAEVVDGTTLRAGDDAADARWVPLPDVSRLPLVSGLAEFLVTHGILPGALRGGDGPPTDEDQVRSPS